MTERSAAAFVQRLESDEALRAELAGAAGPDAWLEIARRAGFDVGADDLPAIGAALGIEQLSDRDLDRAAGGQGGAITDPIWGPQDATLGDG